MKIYCCFYSFLYVEEPLIPVDMFICNDVAVQFTESYSDGIEIPIEVGLESDDPICISAKNHLFSSEGRWSHIFLAHTFLNILDTT